MKEKSIKSFLDALQITWGEVRKHNYDLVVLPWGSIEPHNYHLPYLTDCYLSYEIALNCAVEAFEKAGVTCMVMPPMYLGSQNPGQWNLPFCIHTRYETQKSILSDIVDSLYIQNFRKLVIINGHGGNSFKAMIRDLARLYSDFYIILVDWYNIVPTVNFFEEKPDEHGGEQETSVMLYYLPHLVKMKDAGLGQIKPMRIESLNRKIGWMPRNWTEITEDTGIGNPQKSTADKGERYAKEVVSRITDLLIELNDFKPEIR